VTAPRPRLFLIDGTSFVFRAYFSAPLPDSSAPVQAQAVLGCLNLLLKLLRRHQPDYAAVVLDAGSETFRHRLFPAYKAHRPPRPPALTAQLPYVRRLIRCLRLPLFELAGYEADDLIATLCEQARQAECDVVIVSSDKDFMQLVGSRIGLLDSAKDRWIDAVDVHARFGVSPDRVVQVMGLMGDAVDNIPGVPGIGAKTAIALVQQFDTLERLYDRLDDVRRMALRGGIRLQRLLEENRDAAFLSRDLATVRRDAPLTISLEDLRRAEFHRQRLRDFLGELEFANLVALLDHGRL
jgi:DNA polymerase-1